MATAAETNEKAMLALSLRRQNMTVAQIALYLSTSERWVWRLLKRAKKLVRLLTEEGDSKDRIAESLNAFEEMERVALENFAKANKSHNIALGYLNAARDAREKIKKLQQEAGLMLKVPEKIEVSGLPLGKDKVRDAAYALLELAEQEGEKIPE